MKKQIFRQSALDRLSSPEQLDMLFQVVRPAYWAALSALLLLLTVLVVWGFYGTVTTMVSGQGILLRQGARVDASSPGSGRLEVIFVDIDDPVEKGHVIARLAQPDLRNQIAEMRGRVEILRAERAMGTEMGVDKKTLESEFLARRRQALNSSIKVARDRAESLREQLDQIRVLQMEITWRDYVHGRFRKGSLSRDRQKMLVLELSKRVLDNGWVDVPSIPELSADTARAYSTRTDRTLARDLNSLHGMSLVERENGRVRANKRLILAFLPARRG